MLTEHGGIVYMGDRTVVPESQRANTVHFPLCPPRDKINEVEGREKHVLA